MGAPVRSVDHAVVVAVRRAAVLVHRVAGGRLGAAIETVVDAVVIGIQRDPPRVHERAARRVEVAVDPVWNAVAVVVDRHPVAIHLGPERGVGSAVDLVGNAVMVGVARPTAERDVESGAQDEIVDLPRLVAESVEAARFETQAQGVAEAEPSADSVFGDRKAHVIASQRARGRGRPPRTAQHEDAARPPQALEHETSTVVIDRELALPGQPFGARMADRRLETERAGRMEAQSAPEVAARLRAEAGGWKRAAMGGIEDHHAAHRRQDDPVTRRLRKCGLHGEHCGQHDPRRPRGRAAPGRSRRAPGKPVSDASLDRAETGDPRLRRHLTEHARAVPSAGSDAPDDPFGCGARRDWIPKAPSPPPCARIAATAISTLRSTRGGQSRNLPGPPRPIRPSPGGDGALRGRLRGASSRPVPPQTIRPAAGASPRPGERDCAMDYR